MKSQKKWDRTKAVNGVSSVVFAANVPINFPEVVVRDFRGNRLRICADGSISTQEVVGGRKIFHKDCRNLIPCRYAWIRFMLLDFRFWREF